MSNAVAANFSEILDAYNRGKISLHEAESALRDKYSRPGAVFILDMAEFSLSVRTSGIVEFMAKIRRMHGIVQKHVGKHFGEIVKFEADNAFLFFSGDEITATHNAVKCAVAIRDHTITGGMISVSIGICHGDVLFASSAGMSMEQDYFGDAVNVASKLGEDLATGNQILVSGQDISVIPEGLETQQQIFHISGLELPVIQVV